MICSGCNALPFSAVWPSFLCGLPAGGPPRQRGDGPAGGGPCRRWAGGWWQRYATRARFAAPAAGGEVRWRQQGLQITRSAPLLPPRGPTPPLLRPRADSPAPRAPAPLLPPRAASPPPRARAPLPPPPRPPPRPQPAPARGHPPGLSPPAAARAALDQPLE